jgi:GNAT superfamily N-acetyltransferase
MKAHTQQDPAQISAWYAPWGGVSLNSAYPYVAIAVTQGADVHAVCVVYFNPDLRLDGLVVACFGHFEAQNDPEAVALLMQEASTCAAARGCATLIGPMDGSTWDTYRLATDRHDQHYLMDLRHPAWYPDLLTSAGLVPLRDYATNLDSTLRYDLARAHSIIQRLTDRGIRIRPIDLPNWEAELKALHAFCMVSFRDNYLFTPITAERFAAKYQAARPIVHPRYVLMADDDVSGQLCGFVFAVPNLSDTSGQRGLVLKTIARDPAWKYAGLGTMLGHTLYQNAIEDGFDYILHAFMESSNVSNQVSESFSGVPMKHYRLYQIPT